MSVPTFTLIAGPNGSGKSTLAQSIHFEGRERLLNPDDIAFDLNPSNPSAAAFAAGREVLRRKAEYFSQGVSFAVETTLSGSGVTVEFREAKSRGYQVDLLFIALDSPERSVSRIENRVARGGHSIPEADVRRRYARSIANAARVLRLADISRFYDNTEHTARLVLLASAGVIIWQSASLPEWIKPCLGPDSPS